MKLGWCLILLSVLLATKTLHAIEEQNFEAEMRRLVIPFYETQVSEVGTVVSAEGLEITYRIYDHPEAENVLFILQGWTEAARKYAEFIYDVYQQKISVVAFDWRGQGRSGRPLEDTQITYVQDYQQYVSDLKAVLAKLQDRFADRQKVALAHSMGANILSVYLTENPDTFDRVILSSPMLDIKTDPFPEWFAWIVSRSMEWMGFGENYIFGHGPFTGYYDNMVTTSDKRYRMWLEYKRRDQSIVVNGASFSWLRSSLEATWFMKEHANRLTMPILMLQAGKDLFVDTDGQDKVCKEAKLCLKMVFPQAKHEILNETDRIRNKAVSEVIEFIKIGY